MLISDKTNTRLKRLQTEEKKENLTFVENFIKFDNYSSHTMLILKIARIITDALARPKEIQCKNIHLTKYNCYSSKTKLNRTYIFIVIYIGFQSCDAR